MSNTHSHLLLVNNKLRDGRIHHSTQRRFHTASLRSSERIEARADGCGSCKLGRLRYGIFLRQSLFLSQEAPSRLLRTLLAIFFGRSHGNVLLTAGRRGRRL